MGMFLQSVSFRKGKNWACRKAAVESLLAEFEISPQMTNLNEAKECACILDAYDEYGSALETLAELISQQLGDTVIYAYCVDSDFNILGLYQNGECLDKCVVGAVYEEMAEELELKAPDLQIWKTVLPDGATLSQLQEIMEEETIFAEDMLRSLGALLALPVLDDTLLMQADDRDFDEDTI